MVSNMSRNPIRRSSSLTKMLRNASFNYGQLEEKRLLATFNADDVPVNIIDNQTVTSTMNIPDTDVVVDLDVQLNITHTWDSDLTVTLTSPEGTTVNLFSGVGGSGDNFSNTYLDDEADNPITTGSPPFAGDYQPQGSLSDFDGESLNGDWVLSISDSATGDDGVLTAWSIITDATLATAGTVSLDKEIYSVGDTVNISVLDQNAVLPVTVDIAANTGDVETVTLTDQGAGIFTGSIDIEDEDPVGGDGMIQGGVGNSFTVTYEDSDDGNGSPTSDTAMASISNIVEYVSTDTPVDILDNQTVTSVINVPDSGALSDLNIRLDITHSFVGDLVVNLISPDNTTISLFSGVGGSGDNFDNTILDDEASTPIGSGSAPFSGSFQPAEPLSTFDGMNINGDWTLQITDTAGGDTGTLNEWALVVQGGDGAVIPTIDLLGRVGQVFESDTGDRRVDFDVFLTAPTEEVVSVNYSLRPGSDFSYPATPGVDIEEVAGTLTFEPGETMATISVDVFGDRVIERNEEFGIILSNPIQGNIRTADASVVIRNDDEFEMGTMLDIGTPDSPVQSGAVVIHDDPYSPAIGLGWSNLTAFSLFERARGNNVTRDGAQMRVGMLDIDVPNGNYSVTTYFGSVGRLDPFQVILEDVPNVFTPATLGPNVSTTFTTSVIDGRLSIGLDGRPGLANTIRLVGLEVNELQGRSGGDGSDDGGSENWWPRFEVPVGGLERAHLDQKTDDWRMGRKNDENLSTSQRLNSITGDLEGRSLVIDSTNSNESEFVEILADAFEEISIEL